MPTPANTHDSARSQRGKSVPKPVKPLSADEIISASGKTNMLHGRIIRINLFGAKRKS